MALVWEEPKTDWQAHYDAAGYLTGDFFNVTDYNRIKNNILYLRDMATQLFYGIPSISVGRDKHYPDNANPDFDNDNFFADEFNVIENGIKDVIDATGIFDYGEAVLYYENGRFIDYAELNRIESAELMLYNFLKDSIAGKLRLAIRLGNRANAIRA